MATAAISSLEAPRWDLAFTWPEILDALKFNVLNASDYIRAVLYQEISGLMNDAGKSYNDFYWLW